MVVMLRGVDVGVVTLVFFTTPVNQVTVGSFKQEENIQPWISIAGKALASLASCVDFETVFWISKDSFLIMMCPVY